MTKPLTAALAAASALALACSPSGKGPAAAALPDSGVVAVDNTSIRYVIEGSGRPCIVFGSRIYYPRTFSPTLKSLLRCVHMDQRGFIPDTPTPSSGRYSVDVAVADIEAVRQALGLDRFVLVGHSMHGTVALAYTLAHPDRVAGVIAIGAPPAFDSGLATASAAYWERDASAGRKAVYQARRAQLDPDSLARMAPGAAMIANYVSNAALYWADSTYDASWIWKDMAPNVALIGQLFDFATPYRLPEEPSPAAPPALVALGRFDFVVPPGLWEGISTPFSKLTKVVFDHSGHTPQLEEPQAFDARVAEWLKTLAPGS